MNPLLNTPNGTIVKIVSFLLSQRIDIDIQWEKRLFSNYAALLIRQIMNSIFSAYLL